MAKAKQAYNSDNPDDAEIIGALKDAKLSTKFRHPRAEVAALLAMTPEQRKHLGAVVDLEHGKKAGYSGPSFIQTRIKDEEGERVKVAVRRSTLPRSLWWVQEPRMSGLEAYQALFEAVTPDGAVSMQPRTSGGSIDPNPYDDDAMDVWSRARKQMAKAEVKVIETFLRAPDDALVGTHQVYAINSGASKLAEYFSNSGVI